MSDKNSRVEQLKKTLDSLHDELQDLESVDESTKEHLHTIASEIRTVLESESPEPTENDFSNSLEQAAVRFEVSHPVLTNILRKMADGLASIGI